MFPLSVTFNFRAILLHEDTSLIPLFLEAKQRVSQTRDRFATIQVMHWLAHLYRHSGQLHQAYQESLAALDLVAQVHGHAFLAAYFSFHQAHILYLWNRLTEARTALQIVFQHAILWQQIALLTWRYRLLVGIELAAGHLPEAKQALQELEHLHQRGLVVRESVLIEVRLQWWLATGNLAAAGDWAAQMMFHPDTWDIQHAEEFFALIGVYLAQHQYTQAVEILERFSAHLDQSEDLLITITFLVLYALALHQAGNYSQACLVVARLFSLTQSEGYVRVYLDEGEPMRQFLKTL